MILHIRWRLIGAHYHCRIFGSRTGNDTFALYGNMIVPENEWADFKKLFPNLSFLPE